MSTLHNSQEPIVCMVCSAARSGSTMFDLTLGGHSKVASLGEFSFLGKAISLNQSCTCGDAIADCPLWREVFRFITEERKLDLIQDPYILEQWFARASTVIDRAHQTKVYEFRAKIATLFCDLRYRSKGIARMPLLPKLRRGLQNTLYLYKTLSHLWPEDVLIDSSKNVHKALALYEAAPSKIRIIYLVRDGRGVYFSRRSSGFSRAESIGGWRNYNERASRLLNHNVPQKHLLQIRYEDMMAEPESILRNSCQFLSLEFESNMTTIRPSNSHMVNGNDMRFKGTQQLELDERWKTGLSQEELNWFAANDRKLNSRLGYH